MKKKYFWIFLITIIICLFVPIKTTYKDGGTISYSAVLYKIIKWNKLDEGGKKDTDIYVFPNNFEKIDEYYVSSEDYLNLYRETIKSIMQTIKSISDDAKFIAVEIDTFKHISEDNKKVLLDFIKRYNDVVILSSLEELSNNLIDTQYSIEDGMFLCANNIKINKKSVTMEVFKYRKDVGTLSIIFNAELVNKTWSIKETMIG